jgi:hypothetical protein
MIVASATATASTSLLGATSWVVGVVPASSPGSLGCSPAARASVLTSAVCPPRSPPRASMRFAPALSRARTSKRRRRAGGAGGGDDGGVWGDDDVFGSGPWDGFDDAGSGGGGGAGRYGGGRGPGGGGGGWDRSNSEYGDWPALAGASWIWQALCAASLVHSLVFLLAGQKAAEPAGMAPFAAQPRVEGLC